MSNTSKEFVLNVIEMIEVNHEDSRYLVNAFERYHTEVLDEAINTVYNLMDQREETAPTEYLEGLVDVIQELTLLKNQSIEITQLLAKRHLADF